MRPPRDGDLGQPCIDGQGCFGGHCDAGVCRSCVDDNDCLGFCAAGICTTKPVSCEASRESFALSVLCSIVAPVLLRWR